MKLFHLALIGLASAGMLAQTAATPTLTLDEKIALSTDDIKRQDIIQRLQDEYNKEAKPINDHQEALKQVIEKAHPGFTPSLTPQGWALVKIEKKAEEKK